MTAAFHAYLAEAGLEVVATHVSGANREEEIGPRGAGDWLHEVLGVFGGGAVGAEALLIAGGGVRFAGALTACEAQTGLPVVTGPAALVRAAIRTLGLSAHRAGRGRLFLPTGGGSVSTLLARQSTGTKSFAVSARPPVFVAGAGTRLVDEDGRTYLDFAAGSGTTVLGHGHPSISAGLAKQLQGGLLHLGPHFHAPVQARLYDRLSQVLPAHLSRFHPSVSGAEATEVAVKAAMHATGARHFIGFEGGYHGRTFGALAVSGMRGRNAGLGPFAPDATILPFPRDAATGAAAAEVIRSGSEPLAGVILKLVQATAGLRIADPEGVADVVQAARDRGAAVIVDEVFTGFGRTGRMFVFEDYALDPDLVILGKAFGGGLPAGLVAGREDLLGRWPAGMQSATFQLHPAAAATALAMLETLVREDLVSRALDLAPVFQGALAPLLVHADAVDLRGRGAFWAVEMTSQSVAAGTRRRALEAGLITWECGMDGDFIGLVPPLTVTEAEIAQAGKILALALDQGS